MSNCYTVFHVYYYSDLKAEAKGHREWLDHLPYIRLLTVTKGKWGFESKFLITVGSFLVIKI